MTQYMAQKVLSSDCQCPLVPISASKYPSMPLSACQCHSVPISTHQYPSVPVSARQCLSVPISARQYPSVPLSAPGSIIPSTYCYKGGTTTYTKQEYCRGVLLTVFQLSLGYVVYPGILCILVCCVTNENLHKFV